MEMLGVSDTWGGGSPCSTLGLPETLLDIFWSNHDAKGSLCKLVLGEAGQTTPKAGERVSQEEGKPKMK